MELTADQKILVKLKIQQYKLSKTKQEGKKTITQPQEPWDNSRKKSNMSGVESQKRRKKTKKF